MSTRWFSLRRRLVLMLLGGLAVAWFVTTLFSYMDAHHEVDELLDAELAQVGQMLLILAAEEEEEKDEIWEMGPSAHGYQRRLRFQIWDNQGLLLMRSENAPLIAMASIDGFSEINDESGHWRYFTVSNKEKTLTVQVGEDHVVRDELIGHIAWRLLMPALFGLPLIGLWVWVAIRRGLSPLDGIARQIASRDPQQLQPVVPATAPDEIRTMLEALNGLFLRVDQALETERHFTADAAHELRTPLAALLAQLQVAQRARDDAERETSLQQMQTGLVRARHLVEQMLLLARLDPESSLPDPRPVNLADLVTDVCAELGPQILARHLEFDLHVQGQPTVAGQLDWLRMLARNVVDNAVRYTPEGGRVRVDLQGGEPANPATVRFSVADSGPGIPAAQRDTVGKRFHRLHQGEQPGSGLGLAIVKRIADLHGAQLRFSDSPEGGLLVELVF